MARTVEILLTQDVLKLGSMGDIVKVRPGYARNFLLPYGHAIPASSAAFWSCWCSLVKFLYAEDFTAFSTATILLRATFLDMRHLLVSCSTSWCREE